MRWWRILIAPCSGCRVAPVAGSLLHHSCAGTRGASGGPLLMQQADGSWRIVGIAVTANVGDAGGHAVAVGAIDRTLLAKAR